MSQKKLNKIGTKNKSHIFGDRVPGQFFAYVEIRRFCTYRVITVEAESKELALREIERRYEAGELDDLHHDWQECKSFEVKCVREEDIKRMEEGCYGKKIPAVH